MPRRRPSLSLELYPDFARGPVRLDDSCRVRLPGVKPSGLGPSYTVTALGRVYRDDGRLMAVQPEKLRIALDSNKIDRALPRVVFEAFGNVVAPHDHYLWVPPDAPIDELTGARSCAVNVVKLVRRGDLLRMKWGALTLEEVKELVIPIRSPHHARIEARVI